MFDTFRNNAKKKKYIVLKKKKSFTTVVMIEIKKLQCNNCTIPTEILIAPPKLLTGHVVMTHFVLVAYLFSPPA